MRIWVDAHSTPEDVLRLVYRVANREQVPAILVASKEIKAPRSLYISSVKVRSAGSAEEHYLVISPSGQDVVITDNLAIAEALLDKGITVLHPRGVRVSRDDLDKWPMPLDDDPAEGPSSLPLRGEPEAQSPLDTKNFERNFEGAMVRVLGG